MNKIHAFKKFFTHLSTKKLIWLGVGVVAVGGIGYSIVGGGETIQTVKAELGDVREEVVVTGKVVSSSRVSLGFERSGKIVTDTVDVGSRVTEGQTLAVLEQSDIIANLNKAKANLNKALVEFEATKRDSASSYTQAVNELIEAMDEAYIQADDAVRNDADQFFANPGEYNTRFDPSFTDGNYTYLAAVPETTVSRLSDERQAIEKILEEWSTKVQNSGATQTELETSYNYARENLRRIQTFLDEVAGAINAISLDDFTYQSTINGYKTTISSARNKIITALSSVSTAKSAYNSAPFLESAGGVYDDVLAEQARIQSLREDIRAIEADLNKTVLTAPISGVVTQADAKRGEMVTGGQILISILSEEALRVESNVSETSIGRVETGNTVTMTFDAFPQETYTGSVAYVDPGEVLIDEVPTYKVTVIFDTDVPERVRSGLTANLRILTDSRTGVVKLPAYALEKEGEEYFVKLQGEKEPVKRVVEAGLRGEDGSIEIISGLSVGEEVVVE